MGGNNIVVAQKLPTEELLKFFDQFGNPELLQ